MRVLSFYHCTWHSFMNWRSAMTHLCFLNPVKSRFGRRLTLRIGYPPITQPMKCLSVGLENDGEWNLYKNTNHFDDIRTTNNRWLYRRENICVSTNFYRPNVHKNVSPSSSFLFSHVEIFTDWTNKTTLKIFAAPRVIARYISYWGLFRFSLTCSLGFQISFLTI